MERNFDSLYNNLLEMAATFKDTGNVKQTISDIKSQNLPHHYQKPLVAIANDADRDEMIDKIIHKVFGDQNHNPSLNTKKELQDALEKAVIEVSKEEGSKFNRPVHGVSANYLGRWLGTNINVEFSRGGEEELQTKGAPVIAAKEILTKTLTPTETEKKEHEEIMAAFAAAKEEPTSSEEQSSEEAPAAKGDQFPFEKEYEISEAWYNNFSEKIKDFNKRSAKRGVPQITLEETGERLVPVRATRHNPFAREDEKIKLIKFKIQVPQLNIPGGWRFIALVDHKALEGKNLIKSIPGTGHDKDLHAMFGNAQPSHCDHCGMVRPRTSTFVLLDPNDKVIRVGKQCLGKYLEGKGEREIAKLLEYAQLMTRIAQGLAEFDYDGREDDEGGGGYEGGFGGGSRITHFSIKDVISLCFALVDKNKDNPSIGGIPYLSNSKARDLYQQTGESQESTPKLIDDICTGDFMSKVHRIGIRNLEVKEQQIYDTVSAFGDEEARKPFYKKAEEAINWGLEYTTNQLKNPQNNMRELHQNLNDILDSAKEKETATVSKKFFGYLLSLIPMYNRFLRTQEEEKNKPESNLPEKANEYVGKVGLSIGEVGYAARSKVKEAGLDPKAFPFNGPIPVTVTMAKPSFSDEYGASTLVILMDDKGHSYMGYTQKDVGEPGTKMVLKGAGVKRHAISTHPKTGEQTHMTFLNRLKFAGE